jgi:CheY-like chemotaxis protein
MVMRILVVEDVPDVALTFSALIRACGHRTQVAPNGNAALRMAQEFHPELVFVDIGLPGMDGYQVAHRLHELGEHPRIVSVSGQDVDAERQREAGIEKHLSKPVSIDALLSVIGGPKTRMNCKTA